MNKPEVSRSELISLVSASLSPHFVSRQFYFILPFCVCAVGELGFRF